jgi:hypothetical protein
MRILSKKSDLMRRRWCDLSGRQQSVLILLPNTARSSPLVSACIFFFRECCNLIAHHIIAQRAVMNLVSSADGLITAYETSFKELRIEFIIGSTLQTALTTVRILEKVDNICTCLPFSKKSITKRWWPSAHLIHLTRLPYISNASWDPLRMSMPGTNESLIDEVIRWLPGTTSTNQVHAERIFFLLGRPHCGKSTVSHTIAQRLREEGRLGSAIFLARNAEGRNGAQAIFSTMADQHVI